MRNIGRCELALLGALAGLSSCAGPESTVSDSELSAARDAGEVEQPARTTPQQDDADDDARTSPDAAPPASSPPAVPVQPPGSAPASTTDAGLPIQPAPSSDTGERPDASTTPDPVNTGGPGPGRDAGAPASTAVPTSTPAPDDPSPGTEAPCGSAALLSGGVFNAGHGSHYARAILGAESFLVVSGYPMPYDATPHSSTIRGTVTLWARDSLQQRASWTRGDVAGASADTFLLHTPTSLSLHSFADGGELLQVTVKATRAGLSADGSYFWYTVGGRLLAMGVDGTPWLDVPEVAGWVSADAGGIHVVDSLALFEHQRDGSSSSAEGPFGPFGDVASAPAPLGSDGSFSTTYQNTLYVFNPDGSLRWEVLNHCNGVTALVSKGNKLWCAAGSELRELDFGADGTSDTPAVTVVAPYGGGGTLAGDTLFTDTQLFRFSSSSVTLTGLPSSTEMKLAVDELGWITVDSYVEGEVAKAFGCGAVVAHAPSSEEVVVATSKGGTFSFRVSDGSVRWHVDQTTASHLGVTPEGDAVVLDSTLYYPEAPATPPIPLTITVNPPVGRYSVRWVTPDARHYAECGGTVGLGSCNVRRLPDGELLAELDKYTFNLLGDGGLALKSNATGVQVLDTTQGISSNFSLDTISALSPRLVPLANRGFLVVENTELFEPSGAVSRFSCVEPLHKDLVLSQALMVDAIEDTFYLDGSLCRLGDSADGLPKVRRSADGYPPTYLFGDVGVYIAGSHIAFEPWQ